MAPSSSAAPALPTPQTGATDGNRAAKKRQRIREASQATAEPATLQYISLKVCQVVEAMGSTTYSEVADNLVDELLGDRIKGEGRDSDEKNMRR